MDVKLDVVFGVIAAIGVIVAIIFGYLAYRKSKNNDNYIAGCEDGSIKKDISYLTKLTENTNFDLKQMIDTVSKHSERLARCEESTKAAHKRLDDIINT